MGIYEMVGQRVAESRMKEEAQNGEEKREK